MGYEKEEMGVRNIRIIETGEIIIENLSEEERHIFPWISLRLGKKNWTK